jgi:hypothetical protein
MRRVIFILIIAGLLLTTNGVLAQKPKPTPPPLRDAIVAIMTVAAYGTPVDDLLDIMAENYCYCGSRATATPVIDSTPVITDTSQADKVEIVDWAWRNSASGDYLDISGILRNTSDHTLSFIQVFVIMKDAQGKFLATDSGYADVDRLPPGAQSTWKIFARDPGGVERVAISGIQWRNLP